MTAAIGTGIDWAPILAGVYITALVVLSVLHHLQKPGPPRHAGTRNREHQ